MAKLDQISVNGTTYELVPEVAPLFNTSTAYAVGDYVIKDAVLYRFKATHTSGAWSASQVDEVTAGSELKSIKNDKLDKNQGTANAGKYLKVGTDGNVETADLDVTTDKTLSIADKAADAKAVGDELDDLKADLSELDADAINDRLDLTTEGRPNSQIVNIEEFTPIKYNNALAYLNVIIPFPGDGRYYSNPILESNAPYWSVISFLDENGNSIKITNNSSGNVESYISNASYDAIEIEGLSIRRIQYSYYDYLVNDRVRNILRYTLASAPASMKFTIYNVQEKGIAGITKDAWYTDYKPYGGKDYIYSDGLINKIANTVTESGLSLCVEEKETLPELATGVQCVNPSRIRKAPYGSQYTTYYADWIDMSRDGLYYRNPYASSNAKQLYHITFYNEFGEQLTGIRSDGSEITTLSTVLNTSDAWIKLSENGRRFETFVRNGERNNDLKFDCKIAYIKGSFKYVESVNDEYGVTYNAYSDTYVSYEGDQSPASLEKTYNTNVAKFIREYMDIYGLLVSSDMYNYTYPQSPDSVFSKAVRYYMQRFDRYCKNVIRFASFNKYVVRGSSNWPDIKRELADYAVDICGFQECAPITSDGVVTNEIGAYLQGYQFAGYVPQNATVDKALVSHWGLSSSSNLTILTYDDGVSTCVCGKMNLIPPLWYSNAISNVATLSVYSCHLSSGAKTIDGVSYDSFEVRKKEIEGLLAIIAKDTSDFIVVVADTNAFETGFDIATGTHYEWEMFRQSGLTPALPGHESTVTANLANRFFALANNGKVYCTAAYDQIFFSANIGFENYGVVDSNMYLMESPANTPISDHCMIYADLKLDYEAVAQDKLKKIAVTTL